MDRVEAMLAGHEQEAETNQAKLDELSERSTAIGQRLEAVQEPFKDEAARTMQEGAITHHGEVDGLLTAKDLQGAEQQLTELDYAVTTLESFKADLEEERAAFDQRNQEAAPRLAAVNDCGFVSEDLATKKDKLGKRQTTMEELAEKEDFDEALRYMDVQEVELDGAETLMAELASAQQDYEDRRSTLDPRIQAAQTPVKHETLVKGQGKIAEDLGEAESEAAAGDYGAALDSLTALDHTLEAYESMLADMEEERQEYETRQEAATPRLEAILACQVASETLKAKQEKLTKRDTVMRENAAQENFDEALRYMDIQEVELDGGETMVAELEAAKQDYESRLSGLTPKLESAAEATEQASLKPMQDEIAGKRGEMETAGDAGDFSQALDAMDWLEPALDNYETAKEAMAEAKAEYDNRSPEVVSRCQALDGTEVPAPLQADVAAIAADRQSMEQAAASEDYETALAGLFGLQTDLTVIEQDIAEHAQAEQDYQSRLQELAPLFDEAAAETQNATLRTGQQRITEQRGAMEALAEGGDFKAAIDSMDELEATLKAYQGMRADVEQERQEFESRHQAAAPRLQAVLDCPLVSESLAGKKDKLTRRDTAMTEQAAVENFDEALRYMDIQEAGLGPAEALVSELEASKQTYEDRLSSLEPRLQEAAAPVKQSVLVTGQGRLSEQRAQMEGAAAAGNYSEALDQLNTIERTLDAFEAMKADMEQERDEYENRLASAKPRLEQAEASAWPGLASAKQGLSDRADQMEAQAAEENFDQALALMDRVEAMLDGFEKEAATYEAKEARLRERQQQLGNDLRELQEPFKDANAKAMQDSVVGRDAEVAALLDQKQLNQAESMLTDAETAVAMLRSFRADLEAERTRYQERETALRPQLDRALPSGWPMAESLEGGLRTRDDEMKALAAQDDFDGAMAKMDRVEAMLAGLQSEIRNYEQQQAEIQSDFDTLQPRLQANEAPQSDPSAKVMQDSVREHVGTFEGAMEAKQLREARQTLIELDTALTMLEAFNAKQPATS